jgi:hypothetical protein
MMVMGNTQMADTTMTAAGGTTTADTTTIATSVNTMADTTTKVTGGMTVADTRWSARQQCTTLAMVLLAVTLHLQSQIL